MACFRCGLAGAVPPEHFPQRPGLWNRPCPSCERMTVWVTEIRLKGEPVRDAAGTEMTDERARSIVEDYLTRTFKRGKRRGNGGR